MTSKSGKSAMPRMSMAVANLNRIAGEKASWGEMRETFGRNKIRHSADLTRGGALRLQAAGYSVTRDLRTGAYRVAS